MHERGKQARRAPLRVPPNVYPRAGIKASVEVKRAIAVFRALPASERAKRPLLYWLLGSGTPPYKMSKEDSQYTDQTNGAPASLHSSATGQLCSNCMFAYQHVTTGKFICSQIEGFIVPSGWCRLWRPESDRNQ